MPTLPSSLPAGHEPSADEYQAMLDLLYILSSLPAPTSSSSNGTATSGTTETRDAVLGDYSFTVPASATTWRFQVMRSFRFNYSVAGDVFLVNIRDGGAATPTTASTIVAYGAIYGAVTGGPGQTTVTVDGDWVPTAGVHTLSVFVQRINGTGVATPVGQRSLNAKFLGIN